MTEYGKFTTSPLRPTPLLTSSDEAKERRRKVLMPIKIFFCYAHEETLLKKLKTHLKPLQRDGLIDVWHDRDITAGTEGSRRSIRSEPILPGHAHFR
jgi:hypothetical protein